MCTQLILEHIGHTVCLCAVGSIILCACLSANLYTTEQGAALVFVTNGAIYRTMMFAIDSSPHRIPDTFLEKRSPSLITVLCPTLVWHCSFYMVYSCEVVKENITEK